MTAATAAAESEAQALHALFPLLDDPAWRLANLYQIIVKDEDDEADEGLVMPFRPNRAQKRLLARMHTRNLVLKARQLGFTTLVAILWLDTALFSKDPIRCGIIAHEREAAESIFRDKVLFAYEHLHPALRAMFPLASKNKTEILFGHNGASIRVATSMRSGTLHRLHVSEFGKICAKYPAKAREVITGSMPAVPTNGLLIIESTAEGQDGYFHDMTQRALALQQQRSPLSKKDFKLHFFPWWEADEYSLEEGGILFTEADMTYFLQTEAAIGRPLSEGQRAWYVATRRSDFNDEAPLMWQEYPSTPKEAFQVSTEGCYYATQLANARRQGRIRPHLPVESAPVFTFWDLGRGDATAVWFMQRIGPEFRFIWYHEESGEELDYWAKYLQGRPYVYGGHWLPHDAEYKRQGESKDTNKSLKEIIEGLMPGQRFNVVPRVTNIGSGIQATRASFAKCWWDEEGCQPGLARLGGYRKEWDAKRGCWKDTPLHDDASHGADAFRQFGQVVEAGETFGGGVFTPPGGTRSSWRTRKGSRQGSPMAR